MKQTILLRCQLFDVLKFCRPANYQLRWQLALLDRAGIAFECLLQSIVGR